MVSETTRHRIFDVKQRLRRPTDVRELAEMRALHTAPVEVLERLQQDRALAIARHAFRTSPFYRDSFVRAGIDIRDLADPQVLAALPIVDKSDLRDNFDRVRSHEVSARDVEIKTTGGSTGEPLTVLYDRRVGELAIGWRMRLWWDVHPGVPRAKVWRSGPMAASRRRKVRHLLAWPSPRINLNANRMDEAEIGRFLDEWQRVRPQLLMGYVGGLLEVARFVLASGRRPAPPQAIEATAAPVSEAQKAMLTEAFGAPVYDVYQSTEVPVMAAECARRNGLHVLADTRLLEIVDDEGRPVPPGEPGTVVVTDLRNRAFPLIRYRQGDVTSWKVDGCGCGMPFPVLNPVRGRVTDNLHFPSGLTVAGDGMTTIFDPWPRAVRQFQLVQHRDHSLTLRCVPGDDPRADAIMRQVAAGLEQTVRREVPVRLEIVDVIPHDRGKTRFIVREGAGPLPAPAPEAQVGTNMSAGARQG